MTSSLPLPSSSRLALIGALVASAALGGCGLAADGDSPIVVSPATSMPAERSPQPDAAAPSTSPTAAPSAAQASGDAVPGYEPGEIPPVPLFTLPDLGLLSAADDVLSPDLTGTLTSVPGITVAPGRCDEAGVLSSGSSSTVLHGDGSFSSSGEDSSVVNHGDGSGTYSDGEVSIVNHGDGSGTYSDGRVSIVVYGDGSGTYTDGDLSVVSHGDGSGTWSSSRTGESITIHGDGSGTYTDGEVSIVNHGDGSGTYTDGRVSIVNHGDGTALVNGKEIEADPVPEVGDVGDFPSIDAAQPASACGTVISLESEVLFDFGSSTVRPEAMEVLGSLSRVLNDAGAPQATVAGHTDSISDEAFNQTLSEQRAQAVVEVLTSQGTTASLTATGYGETRPVAPNENPDGSDNPAGRQSNRRVEILIPTF